MTDPSITAITTITRFWCTHLIPVRDNGWPISPNFSCNWEGVTTEKAVIVVMKPLMRSPRGRS